MGVITYMLTVVIVIVLAFATTRYLSVVYTKGLQNRHIKVIEKINLATDKSLWLVEFSNKFYFLYTDKHGMTKIDEVSELSDLPVKVSSDFPVAESFSAILSKMKRRNPS